MTRIKRGIAKQKRHKKMLKLAKGYKGMSRKIFTMAKQTVMKAGLNAYRDRRLKKRTFRTLWSQRINAACREAGLNYSRFINILFKKKIVLDRKALSEIAFRYPEAFKNLVEQVKK